MEILKEFEISMTPYLTGINFSPKTGRVSVSWISRTSSIHDAVKWARIAPPNDERKSQKVYDALKKRGYIDGEDMQLDEKSKGGNE